MDQKLKIRFLSDHGSEVEDKIFVMFQMGCIKYIYIYI
jgi:hypothetical protein